MNRFLVIIVITIYILNDLLLNYNKINTTSAATTIIIIDSNNNTTIMIIIIIITAVIIIFIITINILLIHLMCSHVYVYLNLVFPIRFYSHNHFKHRFFLVPLLGIVLNLICFIPFRFTVLVLYTLF